MNPDEHNRLVVDVDGVLVKKDSDTEYANREPHEDVVERLREYADDGFYIILYTARNMRTHEGRIGKINAETAPVLNEWLDEHDIPYDEIHYGKPWCGYDGFYVDDKAIRPSEFTELCVEEIREDIIE
ncbi:capsular biosynthesis protein [Natrarchaeobius halalkaliphilus]|uniref:Capsular biosynthesis protein n=1 Tax=Natrarchaeobius halalkaliphilus TaxID=1679091 RepID=A0A3N6LST9_9EURY|nr:capsular biosynthesis protein [Natrarchaeobius halalkaliphilus]RQG93048.1 capsular biosynthesis protein [Natrarchaeobius halalkaliphilus]